MKEERVSDRQREDDEEKIDVQELLFKYIIHWPWFVGAVIVCLMGAWAYLHMATPVYNISATVLIKDDKKGGNTGTMSGLEELGLSGLINSSQNIDNEIEVLRSKTLVKEVISQLNLNPNHRPHDPRTTFVTMGKKSGMDEYALKEMVGHTIQDITESTYTVRDLEWLREDIEKIK